jgi:hypothetical protein
MKRKNKLRNIKKWDYNKEHKAKQKRNGGGGKLYSYVKCPEIRKEEIS